MIAANRDGATPLWLACINGNALIIKALIDAGADANEKLPLGRTPLMVAARTGNVDAIKVLLDHGMQGFEASMQKPLTAGDRLLRTWRCRLQSVTHTGV